MLASKEGKVMLYGTTSEILADFTMVCMDIIRQDIPIDEEDLINSVKIGKVFAEGGPSMPDDISKCVDKVMDEIINNGKT